LHRKEIKERLIDEVTKSIDKRLSRPKEKIYKALFTGR
jgi:phenylpyruvate tautomerase PptA (4-oxalocrotonate tautomerase family)